MSSCEPMTIGVAGIAGYARSVAETLRKHGPASDPPARLVAVCDPQLDQHADRVATLAAEGVSAYPSFEAMLAEAEIDAVWLPLPIALHAPFTEQALAAGKAVMCEKPAAGTIDEVDAMIAARDRAGLPVLIGFQHIYDPAVAEAKRRLIEGAIGRVKRASVHGCWPRSTHYFARTNWAGCIRQGDRWVLDSPIQNAMAHYVNLPLFLLGAEPARSATPVGLEAELYRAAPIENYDTISARVRLVRGAPEASSAGDEIPMLVLLTHACAGDPVGPRLRIEGEHGSIVWSARRGGTIETAQGTEPLPVQPDIRFHMVQSLTRVVRGQSIEPLVVATIESARAHTLVVNGASEAAPVVNVPESMIERVGGKQNEEVYHTLPEIAAVFKRCAAEDRMLHESGAYGFTRPASSIELRGYNHFAGPHADTIAAVPTSGFSS